MRVGIDVERLRRYAFVSDRGLTLFEPGIAALEGFLNARLLLYQAVYFHRTVRAIDLDLGDVFEPSIQALFGTDSPADRLAGYADLDEYALLHQAARWARGEDVLGRGERASPGDGRVPAPIADGWRGILLRRPGWRSEAELRATYEEGGFPEADVAALERPGDPTVVIDRAIVDARPDAGGALAIEARDGASVPLREAIGRVPAYALIARRYRRA